jgi:hypothetical protein
MPWAEYSSICPAGGFETPANNGGDQDRERQMKRKEKSKEKTD